MSDGAPVITEIRDGSRVTLLLGHEYEFSWRTDDVQHYDRKSRGCFLGIGGLIRNRLLFNFRPTDVVDLSEFGISDFSPSFILAIEEVDSDPSARYAIRRA